MYAGFKPNCNFGFLSTIKLLLKDSIVLEDKNKIALDFVKTKQGATKKIMAYLESHILLKRAELS